MYKVVVEFENYNKPYTCKEKPVEKDGRLILTDRHGEEFSFSLNLIHYWHCKEIKDGYPTR